MTPLEHLQRQRIDELQRLNKELGYLADYLKDELKRKDRQIKAMGEQIHRLGHLPKAAADPAYTDAAQMQPERSNQ